VEPGRPGRDAPSGRAAIHRRRPGVSLGVAPDGQALAVGGIKGDQGMVLLWDLADRAKPRRLGEPLTGHLNGVGEVAFAPDGQTLASGDLDGKVVLWDLGKSPSPARQCVGTRLRGCAARLQPRRVGPLRSEPGLPGLLRDLSRASSCQGTTL
jgi:WD40 repeat protein